MKAQTVTGMIRAALERDPQINLHKYPITVDHGDTIVLDGVVEHIVAKRRAVQLARQIASTTRIDDRLRIEVSRHRQDNELRQAVLENLMHEPAFAGIRLVEGDQPPPEDVDAWIAINAHNEVVRLSGVVGSLTHRRLAEVLAWWTPGTGDVDNRMRIHPPEEDNDDEITDAIRIVLEKESAIDAEQVNIQVNDRIVTLTGSVRTEANRHIAVYNCWYIPGIHDVRDQLTVS